MCDFLSGITKRNGETFIHPFINSHSDLEIYYKLNDKGIKQYYVKWEFTSETLWDINSYELKIDEDREPEWCSSDFKEKIREKARDFLRCRIHIDKQIPLIVGELAILKDCTVARVQQSAIIMYNSEATLYGNSEATLYGNSEATLWANSRATLWGNSRATLNGNSEATLYGNSKARLYGNSKARLYGNSKIIDNR